MKSKRHFVSVGYVNILARTVYFSCGRGCNPDFGTGLPSRNPPIILQILIQTDTKSIPKNKEKLFTAQQSNKLCRARGEICGCFAFFFVISREI